MRRWLPCLHVRPSALLARADCEPRPSSSTTPGTPSKAQTLPHDILELIFAYLDPSRLDPRTLASCTLVCRSWNPPSSAILLRDVCLSLRPSSTDEKPPTRSTSARRTPASSTRSVPNDVLSSFPRSRLGTHIRQLHVRAPTVDFLALQHTVLQLTHLRVFKLNCSSFATLDARQSYEPPRHPRRALELLSLQTEMKGVRTPQLLDVFRWFSACDTLDVNTRRWYAQSATLWPRYAPDNDDERGTSVRDMFVGKHDVQACLGPTAGDVFRFGGLTDLLVHAQVSQVRTVTRFLETHGASVERLGVVLTGGILLDDPDAGLPSFSFACCPKLDSIDLTIKHDVRATPAFPRSTTALLDACLRAASTLRSLTVSLHLTAYPLHPTHARTATEVLCAFVGAVDWARLDRLSEQQSDPPPPPAVMIRLGLVEAGPSDVETRSLGWEGKRRCVEAVSAKMGVRTRQVVRVVV